MLKKRQKKQAVKKASKEQKQLENDRERNRYKVVVRDS